MDVNRLDQLAAKFSDNLKNSEDLQNHFDEHNRRRQRAQELLDLDRIPTLTEDDLRSLFFDSDAFSFWSNKEWEFNNRLQNVGLEGLRDVLGELMSRAGNGLTPDDLAEIWERGGLGRLLSTELLAYRFPNRYWTFNASVTLAAFQILGEDIKAKMPRGQKADPYLYFAIEPHMTQVKQALEQTGLSDVDNLVADIFLWWIKETVPIERAQPTEAKGIPEIEPFEIEQAMRDFDASKRNTPEWSGWESQPNYRYALSWQDRNYPLKEIIRMASGATDFTSGQAQSYLKKKGFRIIPLKKAWMFQANPRIYDLEEGLKRERITNWKVQRYRNEVNRGDQVVYWKAGENRGIYGFGEIISDVYQRDNGDWAVDVEYKGRLKNPILHETLVQHPLLSQMHIMRQAQGTNFRITPEEWAELEPMIGEIIPPDPDAIDRSGLTRTEPANLRQIIEQTLQNNGLHFTPWQVATFYTALQTKGYVILSGISGTGKTKLAQHFASLMPRPSVEVVPTEEHIQITIQPYMLKYNRMIVPKSATRLFEPPPPGEQTDLILEFDNQKQACRLVHANYGDSDYISLLLRGKVPAWFGSTFQEGDTLILEPAFDQDNNLTGFKMVDAKSYSAKPSVKTVGVQNYLFVPVRPDWRDSKSLLGYYNPLTSAYVWTPFTRFILRALQSYREGSGIAWFVILDEMNLARVEYYFADLLSVLESGRGEDGLTREPLRFEYPEDAEGDLPPREMRIPPNLYVLGTVNVDETTHAFSPKVLDRAFTLELTEADFANYPLVLVEEPNIVGENHRQVLLDNFTFSGAFLHLDKHNIAQYIEENIDIRNQLQTLNDSLRPYELHFGYRIFDEIVNYLISSNANKMYSDLGGEEAAFDAAVLMKVLPKFHGSRGKLEAPLKAVLAWCVDPEAPVEQAITDALKQSEIDQNPTEALAQLEYRYPKTAERARRMLWSLYTTGFASFG
jgi:5-methylcytosine-specific restriction protein B